MKKYFTEEYIHMGYVLVCWAAITKYHTLGGLEKKQIFIFPPFWRLGV